MQLYQVDAFTHKMYSGNPAGVCVLDGPVSMESMQQLAREVHQSETAFLWPEGKDWRLRWFTPRAEVDLCGHATLASAHILWEKGIVPTDQPLDFNTASGKLSATRNNAGISLSFPREDAVAADCPPVLQDAFKVPILYCGRNRMDYLLVMGDAHFLEILEADYSLIKKVDCRGVIITARSEKEEYDYVNRFFAPRYGIDEDPVTGSAHCCLGPYWREKLGKDVLQARQVSPRGGELNIQVQDQRVILSGQAVTVYEMKGDLGL